MLQPADDSAESQLDIDLKNNSLAGLLAWLWPGAGHLYQGRIGKGCVFMVCIVSTWIYGLKLGEGHSVYASNLSWGRRLVFSCQAAIGVPALPAVVQAMKVSRGERPMWNGFMAPPNEAQDELSEWNLKLGSKYDLGVLYTMVAGLLNVLAIFDAFAGPVLPAPKKPDETEDQKKPPSSSET